MMNNKQKAFEEWKTDETKDAICQVDHIFYAGYDSREPEIAELKKQLAKQQEFFDGLGDAFRSEENKPECSCPSGDGSLRWPCPVHPPETVPPELRAAINRLLDSDGSRGCYDATECRAAHEEINRLLSAARPVQAVSVPDELQKIANHIASGKNGLPEEWQDWAEEIEKSIIKSAFTTATAIGKAWLRAQENNKGASNV